MNGRDGLETIVNKLKRGPDQWLDMDGLARARSEMNIDPDSFYIELLQQISALGGSVDIVTGDELLAEEPYAEDVFEEDLYLILV